MRYTKNDTGYIWDRDKQERNLQRRKIGLEQGVALIVSGSMLVFLQSERGEIRAKGYGKIGSRLYVIIYQPETDTEPTRIISLRKANSREVAKYENGTLRR